MRAWVTATILGLTSFLSSAQAAGEADVFARLLARLTAAESTTVQRFVLRDSAAGREFCRSVLGTHAAGVADDKLAVMAVSKLAAEGDLRLAQELERRLGTIEDDVIGELTRNPGADLDGIVGRVAGERLTLRAGGRPGARPQFQAPAVLSDADRALADVLHSDLAMNQARTAVTNAAARSPELGLQAAMESYDALLASNPGMERILPKNHVYALLADEEAGYTIDVLKETVAKASQSPAGLSPDGKLRQALRAVLKGRVPADQVESRIAGLTSGGKQGFLRAMGQMNLADVQKLVHGGNPLAPTPDSLLGQYLRETQAATIVRSFEDAAAVEAGRAGAQGPQKLVVAVSPESFEVFTRLFKRPEWLSIVDHAAIVHNGTRTGHGRDISELRLPGTEFKPFPMVLLQTTEAQRLEQYLRLFRREPFHNSFDSAASAPWELGGYCAASSWGGGCTQHVGNMPIGDARVIEYTMPGRGAGVDHLNPAPAVQRLKAPVSTDPLVQRVWKAPGNMQFGEVIGQQGANLRGELANPGWLISTVMGPTSVERNPIVFIVRPDHRLPIPADFIPSIEARR